MAGRDLTGTRWARVAEALGHVGEALLLFFLPGQRQTPGPGDADRGGGLSVTATVGETSQWGP